VINLHSSSACGRRQDAADPCGTLSYQNDTPDGRGSGASSDHELNTLANGPL